MTSTALGFIIEERLDSIKKSATEIRNLRVQELSKEAITMIHRAAHLLGKGNP